MPRRRVRSGCKTQNPRRRPTPALPRPRFACNATRRPASPPINHSPQHRFAPYSRRLRALAAPKIAPVVQIDPHAAAANDQNLANMAHQLEAALRRPVAAPADAPKPIEQKRIEPVLRPVPKAAAAAAAPVVAPQKQPVHSIEQEMASLLGRPGKS